MKNFKRRALVDTGATTSALSESVLLELQKNSVINKSSYCEPKFSQVKKASGQVINIDKQISVGFHIVEYKFTEDFLVLPKMNNIIIGNSFFIKNNIQICPREKILKFDDMSVHFNEIKPVTGRRRILKPCKFNLTTARKIIIEAQSQRVLECKFEDSQPEIKHCSGVVTPQNSLKQKQSYWLAQQ